MDRRYLVEEAQAFGVVHNAKVMTGSPCDYGFSAKSLGDKTVRNNHGATHGPSLADQAPNALAYGHRNLDNPFAWTGHPGK
jgi:hypothetical protein